MEIIDERLTEYGLPPISDVVNNKKKCIIYINKTLKDYGNKVSIPFQLTLDKYDFRVKHVLFSFGLGIVLADFMNLHKIIECEYEKYKIQNVFIYTWLTLCLYHDYGYFIGSSFLRTDNIQNLQLDHVIFDYDYCTSRYSKDLFIRYYNDKYKGQKWDENEYSIEKKEEVGDHGILGGVILFSNLYSSEIEENTPKKDLAKAIDDWEKERYPIEYHPERIPFYQDICYRIMEHNVWKNNGIFDDENHPLLEIDANHFIKIDINESLLFLLSLVDTIEMTKKFCTYKDVGSEKDHYIFPKTLASKMKINVTLNSINLNYSEFDEYITQHDYFGDISRWKQSVETLSEWVSVDEYSGEVEHPGR